MDVLNCFVSSDLSGAGNSVWQGHSPLASSFVLLCAQLALVLIITHVLYFLLKPFKQPRVVSEIMGGIILGPSLLGRHEGFRSAFFPQRGQPVLDTLGNFGVTYVIFLIGVKMDPALPVRSGRRAAATGLSGFLSPLVMTAFAARALDRRFLFVYAVSASLSITSFTVLTPVLSDLNLLNSDLGWMSVAASATNDALGWFIMIAFVVIDASAVSPLTSLWAFLAIAAMIAFIICIIRPAALRIVDRTPPGKPVDEGYVFVFLLLVLVVGLYSDLIGMSTIHGALALGLAIPDGPPLGSALEQKIETIATRMILPLYYVTTGLNTNLREITWSPLHLVIFLGWLGKLLGVLLPSLYFRIPFRDALALGLFMNSKGIVEVVTYNIWLSEKLIDSGSYNNLLSSALVVTAVSTPLAVILCDPSRHYAIYKRRTVQHLKPDTELRILACVSDQSQVPCTIKLLEASHATARSPVAVYLLQLVELVGRSAPVFIPHKLPRSESSASQRPIAAPSVAPQNDPIINAFLLLEQHYGGGGAMSVHPFTTISPYSSMHHEVCRLAFEKRAALVVLPFHRRQGLRNVNRQVIHAAPCSVAVLVDRLAADERSVRALARKADVDEFAHDVAVLFFGGGDDREALAYAMRMARHPGVRATVIRFLPSRSVRDDHGERKMDNKALEEVKSLAVGKRNKNVSYREELVGDMEEIVDVIRGLEERECDMVMVGMRHTWSAVMAPTLEGLSEWSECPELGIIGDFLASSDSGAGNAVLVVKQQDQSRLPAPVAVCTNRPPGEDHSAS